MNMNSLPLPRLERVARGNLIFHTDRALLEATGIHAGFLERTGGMSEGAFASLNLATTVGDDPAVVSANRALVAKELTGDGAFPFVVPRQVHETTLVEIDDASPSALEAARQAAEAGADGILVHTAGVGALLNFADCVPIIIASPDKSFAVVHAGWRGVYAQIAPLAIERLSARGVPASELNVYIGAYIHAECFEVSDEVHRQFCEKFGEGCAADESHIDLGWVLRNDLARVGVAQERIADLDVCTVCDQKHFFSFRGADGVCGRHGAVAFRKA